MILSKTLGLLLAGGGLGAAVVASPSADSTSSRASERTNAEAYTAFGRSVAIAGEFAFVGEPSVGGGGRGGGGRGGASPAGIVHVFRYGAAGWKASGELLSANTSAGSR